MSGIKNTGVLLTLFMCCGWPLICIGIYEGIKRFAKSRDWTNIQLPWSDKE